MLMLSERKLYFQVFAKFTTISKHDYLIYLFYTFTNIKNYQESNPRRVTKKERDADKLNTLRTKSSSGRNLSRYERNELRRLEQDERLQQRIDRKKSKTKSSWLGKVHRVFKPFEVVFGVVFLAISLLMMISLTITKSVISFLFSPYPKSKHAAANHLSIVNFTLSIMSSYVTNEAKICILNFEIR